MVFIARLPYADLTEEREGLEPTPDKSKPAPLIVITRERKCGKIGQRQDVRPVERCFESRNSRDLLGLFLLTMMSLAILSGAVRSVWADVPTILQMENLSQGSMGKVRLLIRHQNPSGGHYVDIVEIDVAGNIKSFNFQPQNFDPFMVDLYLQLQGSPNVKVRAHCNLHGWSGWSGEIQIPEFSEVGATFLAALVMVLLIARRRN